MAGERSHVIEFGEGNVGAGQRSQGRKMLQTREGRSNHAVGLHSITDARNIAGRTLVPSQGWIGYNFGAESHPFPITLDRD